MLFKMVVFDLDGVLVETDSSWQQIHRALGTDNEINFRQHIQNEINYEEFMRSDIGLWGHIHVNTITRILDNVSIRKTAFSTITSLQNMGYRTAIISSGIAILANRVKNALKIDRVYANQLEIDDQGWLTGEGIEVVQLSHKDKVLKAVVEIEGINTEDCVVIGDSQFDVPLFREAGFSIAFNPKDDVVKKAADLIIEDQDLRAILPWVSSHTVSQLDATFRYSHADIAKAVAHSVCPDNEASSGSILVKTWSDKKNVNVKILCTTRIETMLATLNDLFSCLRIAAEVLSSVS
jgi:phosphoserine phosphatase